MHNIILSLILLTFTSYLFSQGSQTKQEAPKQHQYVGVAKCKICHKGAKKGQQFETWEASKHARAFETLKTEKAAKIAQEKGLKVPAYEAPECLKCHVTAYDVADSLLGPKFDKSLGVQCETCHGPGSDYKKRSIMKDRQKAIANGMRPILVSDGTAEKFCRTCHNEESPSFKEFDFKARWQKIAHPRPKSQN